MAGATARTFLIVASLFACPGTAGAQAVPVAPPRGDWLARALLALDAPPSATASPDARWLTAGALTATVAGGADEPPPASGTAPSYDDYFNALGHAFTRGLASREQLVPLALGTGVALALAPFDDRVSLRTRGETPALSRAGDLAGAPLTLFVLSGGLILASLPSDDTRFRSYAFTLSQGLIVAGSLTTAVKLVVRRTRPDRSSRFSFPSGHAAGSFALAAVSSHYYGAKAAVPLYAVAGLVAVSRVTASKHFPSDVAAGAAIGYIAAHAAIAGTEHVTGPDTGGRQNLPSGGITFSLRF